MRLHQKYRQHLIQGAILPMVLYASPAWWNGSASQAKTIEIVQNRGLRFITGAFRTTPISVMQIEASIPPINLTLNYINKRKANAIQHCNPRHLVTHRLPIQHRSNDVHATDGLPLLRAVWIRTLLVTRTCDGRPKRSQMGEDRGKWQ